MLIEDFELYHLTNFSLDNTNNKLESVSYFKDLPITSTPG